MAKIKIKEGEKWYIIGDDMTGECEVVEIVEITPKTVRLKRVIDDEVKIVRYATDYEYITFVEKVEERTYH